MPIRRRPFRGCPWPSPQGEFPWRDPSSVLDASAYFIACDLNRGAWLRWGDHWEAQV